MSRFILREPLSERIFDFSLTSRQQFLTIAKIREKRDGVLAVSDY